MTFIYRQFKQDVKPATKRLVAVIEPNITVEVKTSVKRP